MKNYIWKTKKLSRMSFIIIVIMSYHRRSARGRTYILGIYTPYLSL